jgi:hypothetical protein
MVRISGQTLEQEKVADSWSTTVRGAPPKHSILTIPTKLPFLPFEIANP